MRPYTVHYQWTEAGQRRVRNTVCSGPNKREAHAKFFRQNPHVRPFTKKRPANSPATP